MFGGDVSNLLDLLTLIYKVVNMDMLQIDGITPVRELLLLCLLLLILVTKIYPIGKYSRETTNLHRYYTRIFYYIKEVQA